MKSTGKWDVIYSKNGDYFLIVSGISITKKYVKVISGIPYREATRMQYRLNTILDDKDIKNAKDEISTL